VNLPYFLRLVCECLSLFLLVQIALTAVVASLARRALQHAAVMRAPRAATLLLGLRLAPLGGAVLVVATLAVPSYLLFEPDADTEQVGFAGIALAALGAALAAVALVRAVGALVKSSRWVRESERRGAGQNLAGVPAVVVDAPQPVLALTGLIRPRLVVSRAVLEALSADQLEAAFQHECAHGRAHDNLKRLAIAMTPALPPFQRIFGELESGWARLIEWSADDRAVAGDAARPLALASALVCVSRLGVAPAAVPLTTSLMDAGQDLSARVERLLNASPVAREPRRSWVAAAAIAAGVVTVLIASPALHAVHSLLEELIH